jgi:hypothetical protein
LCFFGFISLNGKFRIICPQQTYSERTLAVILRETAENIMIKTVRFDNIEEKKYEKVLEVIYKIKELSHTLLKYKIPIKINITLGDLEGFEPNERRYFRTVVAEEYLSEQTSSKDIQYNIDNPLALTEEYTDEELKLILTARKLFCIV